MGNAVLFKGKPLCDGCYQEMVDFQLHSDEKVPPRVTVDARECHRCHMELNPEEDL